MKTKIISLFLAVFVILSLCGCNETTVETQVESWVEGGNATNETTDNETTPGSTSGTDSGSGAGSSSGGNSKIDNPLDVDLKGATIKIYQGSTAFSSFVVKDPSTKTLKSYNEILKTVQKELNCKFEVVDITEDKLKSQVMASAAAGKAFCNIMTSRMYDVGYYVAAGVLTDMTRVSSMDLSKDYMNNLNMLNASSLGGAKYAVTSENGLRSWVTLYNKRILKELGYEDNYLYDLVDSKKWNWTNAQTLGKKAVKDLDGKPGMSVEDQWGFLTVDDSSLVSYAVCNSGSALITHDENGYLKYNMTDPKVISSINLINQLYNKEGIFCRDISNWKDRITSFANGHSLFLTMTLEHVKTVTANMSDDFGLLPIPMVEGGTDYRTILDWNADAIMIPAGQSAKDQYNAGAVVQALLSQVNKNASVLVEEYTNRYLCDKKSAENMKIAIDATMGNVECIYCRTNEGVLSGTYRPFWDYLDEKFSSVATRINETKSSTEKALNEINERAKKNKS